MDRLEAMVRTSVALCFVVVAVNGCGDAAQPSAAPPPAAQRLDLGVVGIDARIGDDAVRGSGFVIDGERGLVLTAAHGVWGARSLKLSTGLGVLHGRIVARAPCDDLALLEVYPRIPGLAALPTAPVGSTGDQLLRSLGRRAATRRAAAAIASIPVRTTSVPRARAPSCRCRARASRSTRRSCPRSPAARSSTRPAGSSAWRRRWARPAPPHPP